MARTSKYHPLTKYLGLLYSEGYTDVNLPFKKIEKILKFDLPPSARTHQSWWANDKTHVQARAWLEADWKTYGADFAKEEVNFRHNYPPK